MDKKNSVEILDAVGVANGDFDSKLGDAAYAVENLSWQLIQGGLKMLK